MIQLPLVTFVVSVGTALSLSYIAGSFVRMYDLLTTQNKRIALASVFCVGFSCWEHGIRSFCTLFGLPLPEALALLEVGNAVFLGAWLVLTFLEMRATLFLDLKQSFNIWKKKEL